ncbi:MAG: hypothetical protein HY811_08635 [Planctomycetes bacterium]|nr:hypothetical protein [Planctomycetota bacterium]
MKIRKSVIGIWLLLPIRASLAIGGVIVWSLLIGHWDFVHADSWSQTTFTDGIFTDTVTTTGAADVTLKRSESINTGTGADGAITISTAKNINSDTIATGRTPGEPDGVNWQVDQNVASGQKVISSEVDVPDGFAVGDEIIIINLKGASGDYANVGLYEFKKVSVVASNSITVDVNFTNAYNGAAQKIMVQRVPNYTNVTINSGGSFTCSAYEGINGKGGVVAFRVSGTVTVNVANGVTVSGKGFTGGAGGTTYSQNAPGGVTYNGIGATGGRYDTNGNSGQGGGGGAGGDGITARTGGAGNIGLGGGGGGGSYHATVGTAGGGGGGGGNGSPGTGGGGRGDGGGGSVSTGGTGGFSIVGSTCAGGGGGGGNDGRTADGAGSGTLNQRAYLGGGGGAGGGARTSNDQPTGASGGNGGGIVFISATTINMSSGASITAGGSNGSNGTTINNARSGGGGGGAGGSIILFANIANNSGSITANGGNGGSGGFDNEGGAGGGGRIYTKYYSFSGTAPTPNYFGGVIPYLTPGAYISPAITPTGIIYWGVLTFTKTTPTNTILTVDVLSSSNGSLLVANVPAGTDLKATYPEIFTNISGIKIRANFSTSDSTKTPTLSNWGLEYATGMAVSTTNWSDIINGNSIQMGQSIAHVKFEMKTFDGTARWKRFRIDKGLKAYSSNSACPDSKIEVQVWCENNNNGFWDVGDILISKGNFANGTCYLNMKRWQVTTTSKTYYIVYKLANDIGGGQRAGVKIVDSSYLEFENATAIGVPP